MDNKKIPTGAGTIVLIIIALTVFGVVWKFEKSQKREEENKNYFIELKSKNKNQETESWKNNAEEKNIDTSNWKVCRNEKNKYEFKYPDTWRLGAPVNRDIDDCNNQIEKESLVMWSNIPGEMQRATFSINSNASSREDFIFQNKAEIDIVKELEVGGSPALIYTKAGPKGEIKFMVIFKDGISYGLTVSELSSDIIFDALVANFKLLN